MIQTGRNDLRLKPGEPPSSSSSNLRKFAGLNDLSSDSSSFALLIEFRSIQGQVNKTRIDEAVAVQWRCDADEATYECSVCGLRTRAQIDAALQSSDMHLEH